MGLPKGIRLNNPGNIVRTATSWQGESTLQDDPRFLRFDDPVHGLRALMKILYNYQEADDIENIRGMINRWAPPAENDTGAYVADVAGRCGAGQTDYFSVSVPDNLIRLAQAIVHHENGECADPTLPNWYDDKVYEEAAAMVLPRQGGA